MLNIKYMTMDDIEQYYLMLESDLNKLYDVAEKHAKTPQDSLDYICTKTVLMDAIKDAKAYNMERKKRSQGGQKSASNMTAEQRSERARRAGSTKRQPNKNRTLSI